MPREWDNHIQTGVYCSLVSDRMKFSGFQIAKTSANKRFILLCPCCFRRQATHRYYATSEGDRLFVTYHRNVHRRLVPLHIPSIRIFYIQDDVS
jgi:hypothetical protein